MLPLSSLFHGVPALLDVCGPPAIPLSASSPSLDLLLRCRLPFLNILFTPRNSPKAAVAFPIQSEMPILRELSSTKQMIRRVRCKLITP